MSANCLTSATSDIDRRAEAEGRALSRMATAKEGYMRGRLRGVRADAPRSGSGVITSVPGEGATARRDA